VHTFTSPLGVLVPAFCTWVMGAGKEEAGLWLFRLINAGMLGAAALFAWRRFEAFGWTLAARGLFFGLAFVDSKLVDFSMNGMETALLVLFVIWLWSELEHEGGPRIMPVALACAGLMWTRPDAFILGAALVFPHLCFRSKSGPKRVWPWRRVLVGVLIGGLLYAPWFGWAWWYYGTPIPHTILAKGQVTPPVQLMTVLQMPWRLVTGNGLLQDIFLPTYWFHGNWPRGLTLWAQVLSALAAFAWLLPRIDEKVRRISLSVFLGSFYLGIIILFPWYTPPWTVLAALVLAGLANQVMQANFTSGRPWAIGTLRVTMALCVLVQLGVLVGATWEMRIQQRLIEDEGRREIGRWLGANARPGDTVFMECLGYVGYYSGLKTYDYPGLSSPEVVAAIHGGARRFAEVIARLQPDWLVLRPFEVADTSKPENAALLDYEVVREWDARAKLDEIAVLPGRAWLAHDAQFILLRRRR
jgi:hypothetical protein